MTTKVDESQVVKMDITADPAAKPGAEAPKTEEVTLDGKKVVVPVEVAAALKAAQTAAQEAGVAKTTAETQLAAALEKAKKPAPTASEAAKASADDIETLIFTDPKRAAQLIIDAATATIRQETAVTNGQQAFWNSFYAENDDLKDADLVVKAVMQREMPALKPMDLEKARKYLADATKKELLRLGATPKGSKKPNPAEGGTEAAAKRLNQGKVSEDSPQPGGISAVLKERAAARRAGATGKAAAAT